MGHNSTFCNLKMQMRKKLYIFKQFAKSKKLFFENIYHSPCDSQFETLKPPSTHSPGGKGVGGQYYGRRQIWIALLQYNPSTDHPNRRRYCEYTELTFHIYEL